jgi:hypothetical protein
VARAVTWEALAGLAPLRDRDGLIRVEEVDEDTRTVVFRVHGRRSVAAALDPAGGVHFDGEAPAALLAALEAERPA